MSTAINVPGPWRSENDPVAFFLTHDPASVGGGLTRAVAADPCDARVLAHFATVASSLGTQCVSLDAFALKAKEGSPARFESFLRSMITVSSEGSLFAPTFDETEAFKSRVLGNMSDEELAMLVGNDTRIVVERQAGDGSALRAVSYTVNPMHDLLEERRHICTPLGFVSSERWRPTTRLISFVLEQLGMRRLLSVPAPLRLSGEDYIPLGSDLCLFGTGPKTDEATVRFLLGEDVLGARVVATVRNLFDRDPHRDTLEKVVKFIGGKCVLVAKGILGKGCPRRRLVVEHTRMSRNPFAPCETEGSLPRCNSNHGILGSGESHNTKNIADECSSQDDDQEEEYHVNEEVYSVTNCDIELGEYLRGKGATIIEIPDNVFEDVGLAVFNLGRGQLLVGSEELAVLIRACADFSGSVLVMDPPEDVKVLGMSRKDVFQRLRARTLVMRTSHPDGPATFTKDFDDRQNTVNSTTSNNHNNTGNNINYNFAGSSSVGRYFLPPRPREDRRQSTNTVLMVAPVGFKFNAETAADNHYMHKLRITDDEIERRALLEFSRAHSMLTNRGVRVMLFSSERFHNTPDACFPNNWLSTHADAELGSSTLVFYPMATASRRAERRENIVSTLQTMYSREISFVQWETADFPHFLESTGVLILDRVHRVAYAALSQRCNKRISETWAKRLNYDLNLFRATDAHNRPIYHTNVMMSLGTTCSVVCLEAIIDKNQRDALVAKLESTGREIVEISRDQVSQFCGNVLELRDGSGNLILVMSTRAYNAFTSIQKKILLKHFHELIHTDMTTIEDVGGGGIRCTLAEIF